ncbi:hypothetical protein PIB30_093215 [Stylosanthes scabra]|uniref:Uncharacterized protein n=1 Tax=Stylosanthes scabra TaxID=79078 RepID=A0ABU6XSR3_9FABA|nr:hypothetical protein [Stylosanthes scabra]
METEMISDEDIADVAATKKVAEIFFDRLLEMNFEPVARAAAGRPPNGAVAREFKTFALVYGNVTFKDVYQSLSKQMMEGTYSYDQGYTPWNPPPYQHQAPQYNVYQSNGFGNSYYGYEDPPPPYPPSQGNLKNIFQVLLQERKEFWETQRRLEAQLATITKLVTRLVTLSVASNSNTFHPSNFGNVENLNHKEVHECLEEVEEENVDQEVVDEDKELKGTEILQSTSSEATLPESPSKLHFEWVNLSDMNLLGPQHDALLETDAQLRVFCGVFDKKEMDDG